MEQTTEKKNKPKEKSSLAVTIVAIVLCVFFGLLLIYNVTYMIMSFSSPERPPMILGSTPVAVKTESMVSKREDSIDKYDIIIVKKIDYKDVKVGDIIMFREQVVDAGGNLTYRQDEDGNVIFTTHRVTGYEEGKGYITCGDSVHNMTDDGHVTESELIGIAGKARIPLVGWFVLEPYGIWVLLGGFVVIGVIAFLVYFLIQQRQKVANTGSKTAELEAELERLRALAAAAETKTEGETAETADTPPDNAE